MLCCRERVGTKGSFYPHIGTSSTRNMWVLSTPMPRVDKKHPDGTEGVTT